MENKSNRGFPWGENHANFKGGGGLQRTVIGVEMLGIGTAGI